MLEVGQKAPQFSLASTSGRTVSLGDFAGKKVVLYFYPRDDTPGCTVEACDFRDADARVRKAGAVVLGVSSDTLASHAKFRSKYSLPFDLLVDPQSQVARAFGAYGEKTLYGKKIVGTIRSTFLIDESGKIAALWSPVKVKGHADQVVAALAGATGELSPASAAKKPAKKSAKPATVKPATTKPATAKSAKTGVRKAAKKR